MERTGSIVFCGTVLCALVLFFSGCAAPASQSGGKFRVVTTLFPQYDFVRQIGGDRVSVSLLLPPGVEAHAYEPTPRDMMSIRKAALFIYTGEVMEPWAAKIAEVSSLGGTRVTEAGAGIELAHEGEHEEEAEEGHHHEGGDPHIWLDPVLAKTMVSNVLQGLIASDPANAAFYSSNAGVYLKELEALDRDYRETLSRVRVKEIVYGGHFAFGYLARRYGLTHISPYSGFSPDAEPSPKKLADLIELLKKSGTKTIFYEEMIDPRVAKVIASQTGAELVLLHGAHNVSRADMKNGVTYLQIMRSNLEKLKKALGYQE